MSYRDFQGKSFLNSTRDGFKNKIAVVGVSGDPVQTAVVKATRRTEEPPKPKHVLYLRDVSSNREASSEMFKQIEKRLKEKNWVVVMKALALLQILLKVGHDRFIAECTKAPVSFRLSKFADKSDLQAGTMSRYVRRLATYVEERIATVRVIGYDYARDRKLVKSVGEMSTTKILQDAEEVLPVMRALLEMEPQGADVNNVIISAILVNCARDLAKLYISLNVMLLSLLEDFFKMSTDECKRVIKVYEFLMENNQRSIDFIELKGIRTFEKEAPEEVRDITTAPRDLLVTLKTHVAAIEGGKEPPTLESVKRQIEVSATQARDGASQLRESFGNNPQGGPQINWGDEFSDGPSVQSGQPAPAQSNDPFASNGNNDPFASTRGSGGAAPYTAQASNQNPFGDSSPFGASSSPAQNTNPARATGSSLDAFTVQAPKQQTVPAPTASSSILDSSIDGNRSTSNPFASNQQQAANPFGQQQQQQQPPQSFGAYSSVNPMMQGGMGNHGPASVNPFMQQQQQMVPQQQAFGGYGNMPQQPQSYNPFMSQQQQPQQSMGGYGGGFGQQSMAGGYGNMGSGMQSMGGYGNVGGGYNQNQQQQQSQAANKIDPNDPFGSI
eukprot:Clim_evm10s228 gene=Clim_evmTU10s228